MNSIASLSYRALLSLKHSRLGKRAFSGQTRDITPKSPLWISEEIRDAVNSGKPIVALETTIYTHGFPFPENVALASALESIVRDTGAIPATIGILDGIARVGMSSEELIQLTSPASEHDSPMKVSRRDLAYICGLGFAGKPMSGGTTIAGTMVLAHAAGIRVFATGGLGGVHRGGKMDISADLTELGRTPLALISSGCKGFLDLPRTLEYLETQGVFVATFNDGNEKSDRGPVDFPAFWSRESGVQSPMVVNSEAEAAAIIHAQSLLQIDSGLLFANPIPLDSSIPKDKMDRIIEEAVYTAEKLGISGHRNTPFILKKINELTDSESVRANIALVKSNVAKGAKVAIELSRIQISSRHMSKSGQNLSSHQLATVEPNFEPNPQVKTSKNGNPTMNVMVAGAIAMDFSCDHNPQSVRSDSSETIVFKSSNPAQIAPTLGGVGRNIARAVNLLGKSVRLCSIVGDDICGRAALAEMAKEGQNTRGIRVMSSKDANVSYRTPRYIAFNDSQNELVVAMADMSILENSYSNFSKMWEEDIELLAPRWLVIDANWDTKTLRRLLAGKSTGARIAFEPVSAAKSKRLFSRDTKLGIYPLNQIDIATPNAIELHAMHTAAQDFQHFERQDWQRIIRSMGITPAKIREHLITSAGLNIVGQEIPHKAIALLPFLRCLCTKLGSQGVLVTLLLDAGDPRLSSADYSQWIISRASAQEIGFGGVYMRLFPASVLAHGASKSVNGAGDTFLGVLVAGLSSSSSKELVPEVFIEVAQKGSMMTLNSNEAVHPELGLLKPELEVLENSTSKVIGQAK
ncbi:MAG: hypothetical protein M1829_003558 [Trizodia sp. TS-e1964]|nr:MAG: hypothetical protein M1829_003558 [Trizodia sp. TS-e1964]